MATLSTRNSSLTVSRSSNIAGGSVDVAVDGTTQTTITASGTLKPDGVGRAVGSNGGYTLNIAWNGETATGSVTGTFQGRGIAPASANVTTGAGGGGKKHPKGSDKPTPPKPRERRANG